MPSYRNIHQALPAELARILRDGKQVHSRDGDTRELLANVVTLEKPLEMVQFHAARGANPFLQVAETLWVLAGRNDATWLEHYSPRALNYADDGVHWRGGYGPRLRRWPVVDDQGEEDTFDQLEATATLLLREPGTRRAIISLWDPVEDLGVLSKDVPCNNWLQFIARDDTLHLHVTARSNDIWWGWSGINTFTWSVLLDAMALWTGKLVGTLTTFAGSWHLYDRHRERAFDVVLGAAKSTPPSPSPHVPWTTPLDRLDVALDEFFAVEAQTRNPNAQVDVDRIKDPFLQLCARLLFVHNEWKAGAEPAAIHEHLDGLPPSDLATAARQFLALKGY